MSDYPQDRPVVDVAVGVLVERDADGREGRFLLTTRPPGKVYAGYWEFPGGKIEPGESVEQALARELHEELGITIAGATPWQVEMMDYPHARVRLHFCKVFEWSGAFEMREGQTMAWSALPVREQPVLPGTIPVLRWFAAERGYTGATHIDWLDEVRWDRDGLVPVIAQEQGSGDVLMFAWMNRAALALTAERGEAVYWSRSRQKLWHKGEESGHTQTVHAIRLDCDNDVVLLTITQNGHDPGIACHTGRHSCFFQRYDNGRWLTVAPVLKDPDSIYTPR
ncbi:MAG: phosphoribosyl-AMP cyclohydrolase [Pelomonas sp.]|nr:phosphoribosyl-AMP cyclohydrolase [Roseateles sp.]